MSRSSPVSDLAGCDRPLERIRDACRSAEQSARLAREQLGTATRHLYCPQGGDASAERLVSLVFRASAKLFVQDRRSIKIRFRVVLVYLFGTAERVLGELWRLPAEE